MCMHARVCVRLRACVRTLKTPTLIFICREVSTGGIHISRHQIFWCSRLAECVVSIRPIAAQVLGVCLGDGGVGRKVFAGDHLVGGARGRGLLYILDG